MPNTTTETRQAQTVSAASGIVGSVLFQHFFEAPFVSQLFAKTLKYGAVIHLAMYIAPSSRATIPFSYGRHMASRS